jgi:hypothetical protein
MRPILSLFAFLLGLALAVAAFSGANGELESIKLLIQFGLGDKDALLQEFFLTRGALLLGALMCIITSLSLGSSNSA